MSIRRILTERLVNDFKPQTLATDHNAPMSEAEILEREVLAHRYLYYVLAEPALPDATYDILERRARAVCPTESPVHGVGSSLPSSYSVLVKEYAMTLITR